MNEALRELGFRTCPSLRFYLWWDDGLLPLVAHGCTRVLSKSKVHGLGYLTLATPSSSETSQSPAGEQRGADRDFAPPQLAPPPHLHRPHRLQPRAHLAASAGELSLPLPPPDFPSQMHLPPPVEMPQDVSDLGSPLSHSHPSSSCKV